MKMPAKSRSARGMILTRYAMGGVEFIEEFLCIAPLASVCLF